mgnify:CR=1 FL=1
MTDVPLSTAKRINDYCHAKGIYFIGAEVRGLFAWAFADFGEAFEIYDQNGEEAAEDDHEQDRHEIDRAAVADRSGDRHAELLQQHAEVRTPPLRDHARAEEHLQDQIPPDDPGEQLAQRRV